MAKALFMRSILRETAPPKGRIIARLPCVSGAVEFRVGTASWTDPTLVNSDLFFPPSVRSAEERLRFYAEQFNTVEVDSTYYALPAERKPYDMLMLMQGNYKPFYAAASTAALKAAIEKGEEKR